MSEPTEPTDPTKAEEEKKDGELTAEKKEGELTEEELEDASGGAGGAGKPKISIKKIEQTKQGPTSPALDPGKVMHSPNNST